MEAFIKAVWGSWVTGLFLLLVAVITCLWFLNSTPGPGYAIGVLGAAAAVMSIREMKPTEKMVWTVVVFVCLFVELKAIRVDRIQNEKDQKEIRAQEAERFQSIVQDFTTSMANTQSGFNSTMRRSDAIMAATHRTLNAAEFFSGGKTFPVATVGGGSIRMVAFNIVPVEGGRLTVPNDPRMDERQSDLPKFSNFPLRSVNSTLSRFDPKRSNPTVVWTFPFVASWHSSEVTMNMPSTTLHDAIPIGLELVLYKIETQAMNGAWTQLTMLRKVENNWEWRYVVAGSYRVPDPHEAYVIFADRASPAFPRADRLVPLWPETKAMEYIYSHVK